ncbi:MAG: TonB-dependent receptor [Pseudomonadota bacterium]
MAFSKTRGTGGAGALCVAALIGTTSPAQEVTVLPELTVTGERRERSLLETTGAVSVIEGTEAERDGGDTVISDIVTRTPNVFVEGPSEIPSIRGVQGGGAGGLPSALSTGALPRTAVIRDGIARPASIANSSFTSLWDVEQVEVLRGPQTLLRGRTGFAGAVIVETKDPTFVPEAAVQGGLRFDEFNGVEYVGNAMVSGPITDTVAGRLTVEYGAGDDPRDVVGPGGDFITEYDRLALRGKLLGEFETGLGDLDAELLLEHQFGQTPQTRNTVEGPGLGQDPGDRLFTSTGPARTFDTDATTAAVTLTLDRGPWQLQSVSGFTSDAFESVPEQIEPTRFDADEQIYSQEFLLSFGPQDRLTAGQFGGLVGLAFEERRSDVAYFGLLNGELEVDSSSQAVFADLRYGLSDAITLEAGARLLRFADDRTQTSSVFFPPLGGLIEGAQDFSETDIEILPRVGIAYHLSDAQVVSASIRRGYNPGGASVNFFNGQPYQYDSERVWTAETTYRAELSSPRLTFGATAFYNHFDNPQFFAELVPGNRGTLQIINQDRGRSFGAEIEVRWAATDVLTFDASLGLLQTEITRADANTPQLEGNSFGQDPTVTASLGAAYQPTDWLRLDGRVTYRGESENDFNNIPGQEVGDYVIVDLGATASYGNADLRAFVRNATNADGITRRLAGNTFVDVTEPLLAGVTLTLRF